MSNQFVAEAKRQMAIAKARNMRYKKPMLAELGWYSIRSGLDEIEEGCSDVHWFFDDEKNLVSAFDGDDDEAFEFQMVFADVESSAERLREQLDEIEYESYGAEYDDVEKYYNDCTVALIGNRYRLLGFDDLEEDYYSLTKYDEGLAVEEAGKRLMRKTKAEIISTIGHCMGLAISYADLRYRYDNIKAALDVVRGKNQGILDTISRINDAYERANDVWSHDREYDSLLDTLPDEIWTM